MLKQILAGTTVLAAMALTTGAMALAIDEQNYEVLVNITVAEEVSMWANHDVVNLLMDGQDANNSATFESSISHINNVSGDITATVAGTLPAPIVPGGGINFFIFNGGTAGDAVTAITDNAYNPAGALVWNHGNLGATHAFDTVATSTSITTLPVVYASSAPGEIPLPDTFNLTVTWTIAATP